MLKIHNHSLLGYRYPAELNLFFEHQAIKNCYLIHLVWFANLAHQYSSPPIPHIPSTHRFLI